MFLTLTSDSYGKVTDDGTPADPAAYDYIRAARDAIHFAALFDRFIQNLRRVLGYEAQYYGGVEPQKRLAPHVHLAVRGSVPRALLRQVLAATYHQVWWPSTDTVVFDGNHLPVWDESSGNYLDPATGEVLQTWDDALDAIGPADRPRHVARFGPKFDAQGVLAGSKDAEKCIGYLTKYLTKQVADCHVPETEAQRAHADRLAEALAMSRARRPARTGYATASSRRTPALGSPPAGVRGRRTGPSTAATPGAASWSPASGPARLWPTTAPTGRPGWSRPSAWRCPSPAGTAGPRSPRPTRTTCHPSKGCCT